MPQPEKPPTNPADAKKAKEQQKKWVADRLKEQEKKAARLKAAASRADTAIDDNTD